MRSQEGVNEPEQYASGEISDESVESESRETRVSERPPRTSNSPESDVPTAAELSALVERIQRHDDAAARKLFDVFNRGIRFQLVRQLGTADLDDKVHDTFVIVLQAIVNRDLRDSDKLLAFIRTVVRRQIATYIEKAVIIRRESSEIGETEFLDPASSPEDAYLLSEKRRVMRQTLSELGVRDREILIRFYIDEMSMEEICEEMDLTINQFRLLKSRAKARFQELGCRQLRPKVLARYHTAAAQ